MTSHAEEHSRVKQAIRAFWPRLVCDVETQCWVWQGPRTSAGYGHFAVGTRHARTAKAQPYKDFYVHRYAYELLVGPIPEGWTIDHLCRNKACGNPAHLDVVTLAENVRRALPFNIKCISATNAAKTHCVNGHLFTHIARNQRCCRTCKRASDARRRARLRLVSRHDSEYEIVAVGPRQLSLT